MPETTDNPASKKPGLPQEGASEAAAQSLEGGGGAQQPQGDSFDLDEMPTRSYSAAEKEDALRTHSATGSPDEGQASASAKNEHFDIDDGPHAPKPHILNPRDAVDERLKKKLKEEEAGKKALEKTQVLALLEKDKRKRAFKAKLIPGFFVLSLLIVIAGVAFLNYSAKRQAEEQKKESEIKKQEDRLKKTKAAKDAAAKKAAALKRKAQEPEAKPEAKPEVEQEAKAESGTKDKADAPKPHYLSSIQMAKPKADPVKIPIEVQIADARIQALDSMRTSDPEQAVIDYKDKLKSLGMSGIPLALAVIPLAQNLQDYAFSKSCLDEIAKDTKYAPQWRINFIRHNMLYGSEIPSAYELKTLENDADARELRMICLIANDNIEEALRMPIPEEEAPNFWKIFLCWRNSVGEWQTNAQKLVWREAASGNQGKSVATRLWLGSIKVEDARRLVPSLPSQDAALLRLMLAEYYKKCGNRIAAQVLYTKALNTKPNLYRCLIERLRDK